MNKVKTTLDKYDFKVWKQYRLSVVNNELLYTIHFIWDISNWEVIYWTPTYKYIKKGSTILFEYLWKQAYFIGKPKSDSFSLKVKVFNNTIKKAQFSDWSYEFSMNLWDILDYVLIWYKKDWVGADFNAEEYFIEEM